MGRIRAEDIESLVEDVLISLELDNFEKFQKSMDKLLSLKLEKLSEKEAQLLYRKILSIQERISEKQIKIAKKIKNSTDIQKYGSY